MFISFEFFTESCLKYAWLSWKKVKFKNSSHLHLKGEEGDAFIDFPQTVSW